MKKNLTSAIILLFLVNNVQGQNLVPNGDFETYSPCPASSGQLDVATSWFNPATLTPDYYNICAGSNGGGVPDNDFGHQMPHSGNGYAGVYGLQFPYIDVREYACAQLTQTLVAGTSYLIEYYINLSEVSLYAVTTFGAYLAPTPNVTLNGYLINAVPQIENTSLLTDTLGWMLISGTYVATGGEQYIIVGSFKDDSNCGMQTVNGGSWTASYYYIDDVSITALTSIEEQNIPNFENLEYLIYPNPVKDELFVNCYSLAEKKEIKIIDVLGKEIYRDEFSNSNFKFPVSNFQTGIYFVEINDGKNNFRKKFLKE